MRFHPIKTPPPRLPQPAVTPPYSEQAYTLCTTCVSCQAHSLPTRCQAVSSTTTTAMLCRRAGGSNAVKRNRCSHCMPPRHSLVAIRFTAVALNQVPKWVTRCTEQDTRVTYYGSQQCCNGDARSSRTPNWGGVTAPTPSPHTQCQCMG
jgi:hypothetical protein